MIMVKILSPELHNKLISIDRKTIRGSHDGFKRSVHILSRIAADTKRVIGHLKVGDKTNEISMLPDLTEMLDLEGKGGSGKNYIPKRRLFIIIKRQ
jgi:hypothetical protein